MVAVVGRANVGKSTLLNRILEEKVSIVSPVAQTTRNLIRSILTEPRGQLVFLDTPGMHKAESDLGKIMNRAARASVEGVDAVLLILDASTAPRQEDEGWMRRLAKNPPPHLVIVLNKIDQATEEQPYRDLWDGSAGDDRTVEPAWHRVSALQGTGVADLVARLFALMPVGPLLFPEDVLTDFPRKLNMADVVREKFFARLEQELPHSLAVWIEDLDDSGDRWNVRGIVYVQRAGQKGIVLGKKGRLIKWVKEQAEAELSELYEVPVHLDLWVKVEKHWDRNFWIMRNLGYQ
jgi:GTP-binding protein Era